MDRTQRLVDLIAYLLAAREPVPFEDIRAAFPDDYDEESQGAAERKFERDKVDLLELGVPLRYVASDEFSEGGYVVDRERFFLPAIAFEPEEIAVLFLAGSAALSQAEFPYRRDLNLALQKIALRWGGDERGGAKERVILHHPTTVGGAEIRERLGALQAALAGRKRVRFTYDARSTGETTRREVDPYGLFCRRGRWSLVGRSHERRAVRVFSLHRMTGLEVNPAKPRTADFEVPDDFDLRAYVDVPAWRFDVHEPRVVEIDVQGQFAWLAQQDLGAVAEAGGEGLCRVKVEVTNAEAIVEWALSMGDKARVVSPPDVRARVRAALEAILARSGGAGA